MTPFIKYIQNEQHYSQVLMQSLLVKTSLWIGTADIKDLHAKEGASTIPFLGLLSRVIAKGVNVRLLHAKEPGSLFRNDFDRYPNLAKNLERALCPRVHFKLIIFDLQSVYIGSANLTGAALGMKSAKKRNFEAGILTNHPQLMESALNQFDLVWQGSHCRDCDRKAYCGDRINA